MKDLKMYINGRFVESRSGKWIDVLNPSTEEVISRQPEGTIEDVNEALDAARAAQPKGFLMIYNEQVNQWVTLVGVAQEPSPPWVLLFAE